MLLLDIITLIISLADIKTVLKCRRLNIVRNTIKSRFFIKQWEINHNYPLNHLTMLLLLNPDKKWNWGGLSQNPNITWKIIKENPDKKWNWYGISLNPNITWEIIKANPDKPWHWGCISYNQNITWEIIEANPDKEWYWWELSWNKFTKPFNLDTI